MSRNKRTIALAALLPLAVLGLEPGLKAGTPPSPGKAPAFSRAEFQELKPLLDVKNQPLAHIPWKYSLTEARKLAAATHKPIFMIVNTGNALGCV